MREGLSVNGAEGLGGSAEGFEQQNQGVTRRRPGEGPKVSGGRSQSQEMDSYDQPQFKNEAVEPDGFVVFNPDTGIPWKSPETDEIEVYPTHAEAEEMVKWLGDRYDLDEPYVVAPVADFKEYIPVRWDDVPDLGESWNGYGDPGGFENQEHRGLTNPGRDITDEAKGARDLDWRPEHGPFDQWVAVTPAGEYFVGKDPDAEGAIWSFFPTELGDDPAGARSHIASGQAENVEAAKERALDHWKKTQLQRMYAPEPPRSQRVPLMNGADPEIGATPDYGSEEMAEATLGGEADVWIAWSPGEYGANGQQLLRKIGLQGSAQDKLWSAGQYAQVGLTRDEAAQLRDALAREIIGKRTTPDVALAKDVIDQIEGTGLDEAKDDELAKSSAKEKGEHPWLTPGQAVQVAKDHEREGKSEGMARMTEVFKIRKGPNR